jgi:RHS repeat-associated protein
MRYDQYHLLPVQTTDALGNRTTADHDYRLLQPFRVTDPNGNRAEVAFDTLGLVAGTAVMGKATEVQGDSLAGFAPNLTPQQRQEFLADPLGNAAPLLGQASTRIVYDLEQYLRTQQPVFAAVLAREMHASDPLPLGGLKVQVSVSYSDGFGREIQKKIQAEPGPLIEGGLAPTVKLRWVGSGWTILNNKGKPVKQFEPFFDNTHAFRFGQQVGVSSTLFYDPLQRVVATLHPNHTWEKVVFDPWCQETWDVNDTALIDDPKTDPDVGEFFQRLDASDYWPTWYAQRQRGALGPIEQAAAAKTATHAATPSLAYADALGRNFLTVAHNRFEQNRTAVEEQYTTRVVFDIEGNQRAVIDANDRVVMRYDYDLLGTQVHQASMEAGERWMLNDVVGQPIYAWDSRGHQFQTTYDALRRPLDVMLQVGADPTLLVNRTVYGESRPNPEANNLRGQVVQHCDQAGVVTSEAYDFKGNLLAGQRQLAREYKSTLNWSTAPALDPQVFTSYMTYDALNRPVSATSPDGSVYRPRFNEANLLDKVEVQLRGATTSTPFVTNIDYDAKGQRTRIDYGNGVTTIYTYDPLTFRLTHLQTLRGAERLQDPGDTYDPVGAVPRPDDESTLALLQDLAYTYDPVGNITHIHDDVQQTIYFNNQVVTPHADYTYDAIYRLLTAEGREHIGQVAQPETTWNDAFRITLPHPQDGQAMRRYTERYEYDAVGNFVQLIHQAANGNWTRSYAYNEVSRTEKSKKSNRLSSTVVGSGTPETYPYDAHGNMTAMPHLPGMDWDFHDQLQHVDLAGGGDAYYVYDGTDQRVRKVLEKNGGALIEERLYLGGFEIFRRRNASGTVTLERETLHIMDDTRRIALVETRTGGSEPGVPAQLVRYQYGNHLGSSSLELDDTGQIISYEEYFPYGSTSYQAVASQLQTPKRYRYTGRERDEESGLSYHGARYYAPWLGRWISPDPAGLVDGPNQYRYVRNNPLRWTDPSGHQPAPDPNAPSTFVGGGITISGGKVRVGPTMPVPTTACDELNPACKGLTFTLPGLEPAKPPPPPEPEPSSSSATDTTDTTKSPLSGTKTWAPPVPAYLWRKTNPRVDPSPPDLGFKPKSPNATFSPGEHALGEYPETGTQYISATQKRGGATNFRGEPYAINPDAIPEGTKIHDTPTIAKDMDRMVQEGQVHKSRVDAWKESQRSTEGMATKPGKPLKGETLIEGPVPPQAVEGGGLRALRGVARGLFWLGVAYTVHDMIQAFRESVRQASVRPFLREAVRQATTWGMAASMAMDGVAIGAAIGGPVGAGVGGLVGGAVGALSGWISGSWLSSLF